MANEQRRYTRVFARRERAQLIDELAVRTGFSTTALRKGTLEQQQDMLDRTRHEIVIDEHEAGMLLDSNEEPRVRDFFAGDVSARTLLDGVVTARTFLDCFVLWSGPANRELLRNGRNLRSVVDTIRTDGGLAAAAERSPWLSSAVFLADQFSLSRLYSRRIFVRHTMRHEALSAATTCAHESQAVYIEEGQHRAIASAWILTRGGTEVPDAHQRIAYIRGVNRRGSPGGDAFWQVHNSTSPSMREATWRPWPLKVERYPTAELCSGTICVLSIWYAAQYCLRRRRVRQPYALCKEKKEASIARRVSRMKGEPLASGCVRPLPCSR